MFAKNSTLNYSLIIGLLLAPLTSQADMLDDLVGSVTDNLTDKVGGIINDSVDDTANSLVNPESKPAEKTHTDTSTAHPQSTQTSLDKMSKGGEMSIDDLNISAQSKLFAKDLKKAMPPMSGDEEYSFLEMKKTYAKQWASFLAKQQQPRNAPYECFLWASKTPMIETMFQNQSFKKLMAERNTASGMLMEQMFYQDYPVDSSGGKLTTQLIKLATEGKKARQLSQVALKACSADKSLQVHDDDSSAKQQYCKDSASNVVTVARMAYENNVKTLGSKQKALAKLEDEFKPRTGESRDAFSYIMRSLLNPLADGASNSQLKSIAVQSCMKVDIPTSTINQ